MVTHVSTPPGTIRCTTASAMAVPEGGGHPLVGAAQLALVLQVEGDAAALRPRQPHEPAALSATG